MSVVIADKDLPLAVDLAGALRGRGIQTAILASPGQGSPSPMEIPWNRSSPLSARTVFVDAQNRNEPVGQLVLVFDTASLSGSLPHTDQSSEMRMVDDHVRSYLLLSQAAAARFRERDGGRIVFVLRGGIQAGSHVPAALAEGAFSRLAEETAASFAASGNSGLQTLLVRMEAEDGAESLAWLVSQIENPSPSRGPSRWVKAGARGLFGRF